MFCKTHSFVVSCLAMKMKIAFVSNLVEPTGGDNILYNHALGLTKCGHKVDSYFSSFMDSTKEHGEDWNSGNVNLVLYNKDITPYDWSQYDIVVCVHNDVVMGKGWGKKLLKDF